MCNFLNLLLQFVQIGSLLGGDRHADDVATKRLWRQAIVFQVEHYSFDVSLRPVDLVNGHDEWNVHRLCEFNHFDCLLLDTLYGRDDQDDNIGHLSSPGPHILESLVPWCINESDLFGYTSDFVFCSALLASSLLRLLVAHILFLLLNRLIMQARVLDRESTDSLCNCTILLSALVVVGAERVQEGSLAVVDMTHDRDNGSSQHEVIVTVDNAGLNIELHADELDGLLRQNLKLIRVDIVCELLRCLKHLEGIPLYQLAKLEGVEVGRDLQGILCVRRLHNVLNALLL